MAAKHGNAFAGANARRNIGEAAGSWQHLLEKLGVSLSGRNGETKMDQSGNNGKAASIAAASENGEKAAAAAWRRRKSAAAM